MVANHSLLLDFEHRQYFSKYQGEMKRRKKKKYSHHDEKLGKIKHYQEMKEEDIQRNEYGRAFALLTMLPAVLEMASLQPS